MTDTNDEMKAQAIHEERLRIDIDYAKQFRKDGIYNDLPSFEAFLSDHDFMEQISRELLRALCNSDSANRQFVDVDSVSRTDEEIRIAASSNISIKRSRRAILEAVSRMKYAIDCKIEQIEEGAR